MSKGIPLTDNDREPWLALIRSTADQICRRSDSAGPRGLVMACSALKRTYRDILRGVHPKAHEPPPPEEIPEHPITEHVHDKEALAEPPAQNLRTFFVFIKGGREVLEERMRARKDHFMKVDMLRSQLETLQDPTGEEGVVVIRLEDGMDEQVQEAVKGLAEAGL
ncbi:hypothetical protein FRB99_005451 [Tulasnella sp. 403]|nr:hypothetical protein FRB99_005451 [Tulasnella sp. 403]